MLLSSLLGPLVIHIALLQTSVATKAVVQSMPDCATTEIDSLMHNEHVLACGDRFKRLLPKKGCQGLTDRTCYCSSPEFMSSMTNCLFTAEPAAQDQLIRCGKWQTCPSFSSRVNQTGTQLTKESEMIIQNGLATLSPSRSSSNDVSRKVVITSEGWIVVALLLLFGWMVLW